MYEEVHTKNQSLTVNLDIRGLKFMSVLLSMMVIYLIWTNYINYQYQKQFIHAKPKVIGR